LRPTLSRLFEQNAKFVGRALFSLGIPDSDLDDAVQEVFMIAARRLAEYEERGAVRSWLWAIALHVARAWKRRGREQPIDTFLQVPDATNVEDALDRKRAAARALAVLDELSREQREVFVLYEIEEMDMREVAEILECPLQTAYWRLHAARARLRAARDRLS
jgi:RNA polymerase sigma-70 factor (ECF subfamily)